MQLILSLIIIAVFLKIFGNAIIHFCVFFFSFVQLYPHMKDGYAFIVALIVAVVVYFGGKELKKYEKKF